MIEKFVSYMQEVLSAGESDKILLAVSGGVDSMVMSDLFLKSKFRNFALAHVNFMLRGEDSDNDEAFVREFAKKNNLTLYIKKTDTYAYAESEKISIEMAARKIRYNWFDFLIKKYNFKYLATAHHLDDSIETFLLNLSRGTGIKGLTGIKPVNGYIIRPLLFAFREEIEKYAIENNIKYRTDKTNFETTFQRNKIRHIIIPALKEINPAFKNNVVKTIENLTAAEKIIDTEITNARRDCTFLENDTIYIKIKCLKELNEPRYFLFEFLRKFGFNRDTVSDIYNVLDKESGKIFYSEKYKLLKDRDFIILKTKNTSLRNNFHDFSIEFKKEYTFFTDTGKKIVFKSYVRPEKFNLKTPKNKIFIDFDKLKSNKLYIRKWEKGDYFYPFGMKGRKKLSDFFVDQKINRIEKHHIDILFSHEDVVWIIGYRFDKRFAVDSRTTRILEVEIL